MQPPSDQKQPPRRKPLAGIRVLEMGQLMAGPFAGTLLAYFGAEVIKVEPPIKGDAVRGWRELDETGTSVWWYSLGRNKKCITLNLRLEQGRNLARRLADKVDVLIENFRPGTMERWGLGPKEIRRTNPGIIYTRVSGYGQDGPYAARPGYASVCEGIGGLRYVNGFPGQPPVRPNLSLGDSLAGLHAAFGTLLALFDRLRQGATSRGQGQGQGQEVDVAIYESVYNMMEAVVPEFDYSGAIRGPSGTTITGIVPTNTYLCGNGKHVIIGGNGDSIFQRLMRAAGRPELAEDSRLADNAGRVTHQTEVDNAISAWTATLTSAQVLEILEAADVPAGPIYSVQDMVEDPHFIARGMFEEVQAGGRTLKIPAILPKLSETPGATEWAGPKVGSHNNEILASLLGVSDDELKELRDEGVV
ncbi:MAG: CaiB/BaiF CoA-transferase family protein [Thermoanaerobaculia bacterium]